MRLAFVLAAVVFTTPARAIDDEPRAPNCHLTTAECAAAIHEVAVDAELFAQDQEIVGLGLSPQDRARALIQRDTDRMVVRFQQLPALIAAEVARMQACQGLGDAARHDGTTNADSRCR